MRALGKLLFALAVILVLACSQNPKIRVIDEKDEIKAVITVFKGLLRASEMGDVDGYMSYLSKETVMMYDQQPAVIGSENIRSFAAGFFENFKFELSPWESDEIQVSGDWAFHRYSGVATITPKGEGETVRLDRKYIDILHKADGVWKVSHHIYNNNK